MQTKIRNAAVSASSILIENLEARTMFASVGFQFGGLQITGDSRPDVIVVNFEGSTKGFTTKLTVNGQKVAVPWIPSYVTIETKGGNDTVTVKGNGLFLLEGTTPTGDISAFQLYANFGSGNDIGNVVCDGGNIAFDGAGGNDTFTNGSLPALRKPYFFGGDGNDVAKGNAPIIADGGPGNDKLVGGDGDDVFFGGDGNDTLIGNDGNDQLYGNAGDDVELGGAGYDYLRGGAGKNALFGGADGDYIVLEDGSDYVEGGEGNDYIVEDQAYNPDAPTDFSNDKVIGGLDNDTFVEKKGGSHPSREIDVENTFEYDPTEKGGNLINV